MFVTTNEVTNKATTEASSSGRATTTKVSAAALAGTLGFLGVGMTAVSAQAAQAPDVTTNVATGVAPPAPPPPPYSLPFQLRPVTVGDVLRSDTTMAFYENAKGEFGESVASMFLASYKLTPDLAPLVRLAIVQNSEPGTALGQATAFVNPILGLTYSRKLSSAFRGAAFLGAALPLGMGGAKAPATSDTATAVSRGIQARSGMDNAMFAVNYTTGLFGLGVAYIANKLTLQLEATLLQLFRTRNEALAKERTRTNFTSGLHVGYFVASFMSLGAEYRYQRWLSTPALVTANPAARETQTIAVGPRFHYKLGTTWLRPALSYATGLDKPLTAANYHLVQLDVPAVF